MGNNQDLKQLEEYAHLKSVLKSIGGFIDQHQSINYMEFDYYTTHGITLFYVEPTFNFELLKESINKVTLTLPSIKRIFAKPIVALRNATDVLPVEVVSRINQKTMTYLGNHSNDVEDITSRGVKPRKLLTQIYEDDYSLYENLVFCNFINQTLSYCRRNIKVLRNLLYQSDQMDVNLLERVNHIDYFLALGKLHTGYIRDFDKYYEISKQLYKDIMYILNSIRPRLQKPVYERNRKFHKELPLKKTNVFLMQKDYHNVYKTYKFFITNQLIESIPKEEIDKDSLLKNYADYVLLLTIFSAANFEFQPLNNDKFNLRQLDVNFKFKKWNLFIRKVNETCFLLSVSKDTTYSILLVPSISFSPLNNISELGKTYGANEVVVCDPFYNDYITRETLYISIENIDSFRRIQQLILKGMIYSDTEHKDCPFCSEKLTFNQKTNSYKCDNCWTIINEDTCPENGEKYFYTTISNLKVTRIDPSLYNEDSRWLYNKRVESLMYFRNITKISNKGEIICPSCGHVHSKNSYIAYKN